MTFGKENLEILENIARCALCVHVTFATKQDPIKITLASKRVRVDY
jgi:hypothetical protein